ncbi:hypothetical protein V6767_17885, partial [Martelella sp. FLE1502]
AHATSGRLLLRPVAGFYSDVDTRARITLSGRQNGSSGSLLDLERHIELAPVTEHTSQILSENVSRKTIDSLSM